MRCLGACQSLHVSPRGWVPARAVISILEARGEGAAPRFLLIIRSRRSETRNPNDSSQVTTRCSPKPEEAVLARAYRYNNIHILPSQSTSRSVTSNP